MNSLTWPLPVRVTHLEQMHGTDTTDGTSCCLGTQGTDCGQGADWPLSKHLPQLLRTQTPQAMSRGSGRASTCPRTRPPQQRACPPGLRGCASRKGDEAGLALSGGASDRGCRGPGSSLLCLSKGLCCPSCSESQPSQPRPRWAPWARFPYGAASVGRLTKSTRAPHTTPGAHPDCTGGGCGRWPRERIPGQRPVPFLA